MPVRDDAVDIRSFTAGGLLPVVTLADERATQELAEVCHGAGLRSVEVLLRNDFAFDAIRVLAESGIEVAAGTARSRFDVVRAQEEGARAIVSAGFSGELHEECAERGMLYLPGTVTATEVLAAAARGLRHLKFFPAVASGGEPVLTALSGPFPDVAFTATGGVSAHNFEAFLALPNVEAVGGAWMVGTAADGDPVARTAALRRTMERAEAALARDGASA
ncbi:keto-deoxy-phosphogluconate aldolase [Herbiconiux sp. YIM B11900]|uniref:keto-deoxy-phosphogluconate aldolase n=1 Tax=Herbiconiux sp. YIM B11900 TaxID=3404131 RepID=UPI003F8349C6